MHIGLLGETRRIRCLGGIPPQPIIGGTLVAGFDLRETPVALGVSRAKKDPGDAGCFHLGRAACAAARPFRAQRARALRAHASTCGEASLRLEGAAGTLF